MYVMNECCIRVYRFKIQLWLPQNFCHHSSTAGVGSHACTFDTMSYKSDKIEELYFVYMYHNKLHNSSYLAITSKAIWQQPDIL